jgi:thioredoxin 1
MKCVLVRYSATILLSSPGASNKLGSLPQLRPDSSFILGKVQVMGNAAEFTDDNFDSDVLKSDIPVLVDFWAPWCGPCRQIAPLIEELSTQYAGKVKVGKINIDEHPVVPQRYGISSIPTLLLIKNGEVTERFVGMPPASKLHAALAS